MTAISLRKWLSTACSRLSCHATPQLEAQLLAANVLGVDKVWVITHPEANLSGEQYAALEERLERLLAGEPLAYLLGEWEFYTRQFFVSPDVLIPRPETELMVEQAVAWLLKHPTCRRALDVGTGSGCVAVSLACEVKGLQAAAVDISRRALAVARRNVNRHAVTQRVHLFCGDLTDALRGEIDLICANLPYIPTQDAAGLQVAQFEPWLALDGGADGVMFIRRLLQDARRVLSVQGGLLLLEVEARQGGVVMELARANFPDAGVALISDLAGIPRLIRIEINNEN